jgi:hypothetical protein
MNYHPTEEQLIDYLHGELAPGADAEILLHLEGCAQCRDDYDAQARVSELVHDYAAATQCDLPLSLIDSIWTTVDSEAPSWTTRLAALLRPAVLVPLAAMLVLAAFLGYGPNWHRGETTIIDAAYYLDDHAALTSTVPFGDGPVVPSSLFTGQSASDQQWLASSGASDVADDGPSTSDAAH